MKELEEMKKSFDEFMAKAEFIQHDFSSEELNGLFDDLDNVKVV